MRRAGSRSSRSKVSGLLVTSERRLEKRVNGEWTLGTMGVDRAVKLVNR